MSSIFNIPVLTNKGQEVTLEQYKANNKAILIVNVASKCGLTKQYTALEKLYQEYSSRGFTILAFPSNDFLGQEPGSDDEIAEFCTTKFNVTFPLFKKVVIVGENKHPLYNALITAQPNTQKRADWEGKLTAFGITPNKEPEVLWNFEKFVINTTTGDIQRFSPGLEPDDKLVVGAIESALSQ